MKAGSSEYALVTPEMVTINNQCPMCIAYGHHETAEQHTSPSEYIPMIHTKVKPGRNTERVGPFFNGTKIEKFPKSG